MHVHGDEETLPVNLHVLLVSADLPGGRKSTGLKGHTSKLFMCPVCNKPFHSLADSDCFDPDSEDSKCACQQANNRFRTAFTYRKDERYLKYAFRAQNKDQASRQEISERRGIRWSVLNLLPDWFPVRDSPPDFMHGAYLGMYPNSRPVRYTCTLC